MSSPNYNFNKFFIRLNIKFENLGDILINLELIQLLAEHGPVVVDEERCPPDVKSALRTISNGKVIIVSGSQSFFTLLLKSRLQGALCWYLLCPGGTVGEVTKKGWARRAFRYGAQVSMALLGVRFALLGMSAERLGPISIKWAKRRRNLTAIYYARDSLTAGYLNSIGIACDGVLPDLAFNRFDHDTLPSKSVHKIGLSFRIDQNGTRVEYLKRLIEDLYALFGQEIEFVFAAQVKSDADEMRALHHWTKATLDCKAMFKEEYTVPERAVTIYSECDIVLSNRLHVLLLALLGCGRIVAFVDNYNQKIIGLLNDIGASDVLLPLEKPLSREMLQAALTVQIKGHEQRIKLRQGIAHLFRTDSES